MIVAVDRLATVVNVALPARSSPKLHDNGIEIVVLLEIMDGHVAEDAARGASWRGVVMPGLCPHPPFSPASAAQTCKPPCVTRSVATSPLRNWQLTHFSAAF